MTRFGAYEILYELKSGGMGAVLLARRRGPGAFEQLVAIKTIRPEYAQAPAVRAMFLAAAAPAARRAAAAAGGAARGAGGGRAAPGGRGARAAATGGRPPGARGRS